MAGDVNVLELVVRLVVSMALVVGIIVVAAKVLRNRGGLGFGAGRGQDGIRLDVLERTQLARNATVAVVRVGGRGLVLGITEQSVTLLAEAPELVVKYEQQEAERTAPPTEPGAPGTTRMNFFEALRESTVRRS
jgi:flagellar biogenesis protein FliO